MKAIIDLGTNTFHLLIAEHDGKYIKTYSNIQVPVKLGAGGINKGFMTDEAMNRGYKALSLFCEEMKKFGWPEHLAFATSAIRNASNGEEFIHKAKTDYGITIKKLTGDDEATAIFNGVRLSFEFPDTPVLVMDIGGGSVEFIIGNSSGILWKQSFEIGAARLMEKFHHHDPITEEETFKLISYISSVLSPLKEAVKKYEPFIFVGSAGSFETFREVALAELGLSERKLSEYAFLFQRNQLQRFHDLIIQSDRAQRSNLKGMAEFRVEMIVVATLLMKWVVDEFGFEEIITSYYALKEGMLVGL